MIASKSAAVGGAVDDTTNRSHDFVGWFRLPIQGSSEYCSAMLLTPRWVVTAAHCVIPKKDSSACIGGAYSVDVDLRYSNFTINFNTDYSKTAPPDRTGYHTYAKSGPVIVRPEALPLLDLCTNLGSSRDIALIRLDNRIDPNLVAPKHPPINSVPSCAQVVKDSNDFEGVLIGFGDRNNSTTTTAGRR